AAGLPFGVLEDLFPVTALVFLRLFRRHPQQLEEQDPVDPHHLVPPLQPSDKGSRVGLCVLVGHLGYLPVGEQRLCPPFTCFPGHRRYPPFTPTHATTPAGNDTAP